MNKMRVIVCTCLILLVCVDRVRAFVATINRGNHEIHKALISVSIPPNGSLLQSTKSNDAKSAAAIPRYRSVRQIQKYARLPVWPAWNGVFIFLMSKLFGQDRAAQLEDVMTGRVCPNFFQASDDTSPFIMLVHHCHTFAPIDPLRYFQRLFFPEGNIYY